MTERKLKDFSSTDYEEFILDYYKPGDTFTMATLRRMSLPNDHATYQRIRVAIKTLERRNEVWCVEKTKPFVYQRGTPKEVTPPPEPETSTSEVISPLQAGIALMALVDDLKTQIADLKTSKCELSTEVRELTQQLQRERETTQTLKSKLAARPQRGAKGVTLAHINAFRQTLPKKD